MSGRSSDRSATRHLGCRDSGFWVAKAEEVGLGDDSLPLICGFGDDTAACAGSSALLLLLLLFLFLLLLLLNKGGSGFLTFFFFFFFFLALASVSMVGDSFV